MNIDCIRLNIGGGIRQEQYRQTFSPRVIAGSIRSVNGSSMTLVFDVIAGHTHI